MSKLLLTFCLVLLALPAWAQPGPSPWPPNITPNNSADPTSFIAGINAGAAQTGSNNNNVAVGYGALQVNTLGQNVAVGYLSCNQANVHAITCVGNGSGATVTTGGDTIAIGNDAMNNDDHSGSTTGQNNTAVGVHALGHLSTGASNVALGNEAMVGCGTWYGFPSTNCLLTGSNNTSIGQNSLNNIQGAALENTAAGANAGTAITTGNENILLGSFAGSNLTTGSLNIMIGRDIRGASATGSNQLNIGNLIQGTGIQQGGATANGEVDVYGKLTASAGVFPNGISAAYLLGNGANELDVVNTNGGQIAVFDTSDPLGTGSTYPILSAGGGSIAQVYAGGSGSTIQLGASSLPTQVDGSSVTYLAPPVIGQTKFTTSGCSISATVGSGTTGTYTSGTTGTCTAAITMNGATGMTAPNGWNCFAADWTTPADAQAQTASSTTTATIAGTTVSGDVVHFSCQAY